MKRSKGSASIPKEAEFELILSDGSLYPRKGSFFAIDSQVDANTGTLRAVALFPNPEGLLRPGQYGRVRAVLRVEKGALVVPSGRSPSFRDPTRWRRSTRPTTPTS